VTQSERKLFPDGNPLDKNSTLAKHVVPHKEKESYLHLQTLMLTVNDGYFCK